jgi:hypothetical protein
MDEKKLCSKCKNDMEPGIRPDTTDKGIARERWFSLADVELIKGFIGYEGIKSKEGWFDMNIWQKAYKVITYRCPKCGLLQSYANELENKS